MPTSYFTQPDIDPVLLHLWGPLQIRWYSLLYVGGFILGKFILQKLAKEERFRFTSADMEQLVLWLLIGAVVGARILYCFVYDPYTLMENPLYLFQTYKGGLSFHGALIGVIVVAIVFGRKKGIPFWNLADAMALATPTGLAMGRMGNFINGELYGRVTTMPWGVIFKEGGPLPRHPSQLYEFFLEGVILFSTLWILKKYLKRDGQIATCFLVGYTLSRFIVEFFREPDAQLGYLFLGLTMGQILSLLMLVISVSVGAVIWSKFPLSKEPDNKKRKQTSRKSR